MKRWRFFFAILAVQAWLFPWLPALRSPNELSRVYLSRAIVDDQTLTLDAQLGRYGPMRDLALDRGHTYSSKAPGVSLLGAPVYAALRLFRGGAARVPERALVFFLRLVICMVPAAAAAELMRRLLGRRFGSGLALAGAVVLALGTLMWPYSTLLMSHGPSAVALLASLYALDLARSRLGGPAEVARATAQAEPAQPFPSGALFTAGLCAGASVLLEYTTALMWMPLAAYGLLSLRGTGRAVRGVVLAALGAIPPLLVLGLYHWAAFGGPFETAYRHLDDPVYTSWHQRGFMGLGVPHLGALLGSFFDPARGLFLYAPFLALALPGLPLLWRKDRPLAVACGSALLIYALFTAGFVYESWGWSVGPRHLTPLCPFLIPPAVAAAAWLRGRRLGAIPAALAIYSVAVFALVVATGPYFPPELTNPVHQLSLTFARAGLRGHDLLGLLLRVSTPWTLLPWIAGLGVLAAATLRAFVAGDRYGMELAAAAVAAGLLFLAHGLLGGPDRFDAPRQFLMERWEPTPSHAPGLFDPP